MDKNGATPKGYMTVGQVARQMQTTVRTLQYYDREGLLNPSAISEGGRRLYTDKDIIRLHQIQSLKYLGFSLFDIKNRLVALDTPAEVAKVLGEQADKVRAQIAALQDVLSAIETLRAETVRMDEVNFSKYADIVYMLQTKNDDYWVLKHFDDRVWSHIRDSFDEDSGRRFIENWNRLCDQAVELKAGGVSAQSDTAKALAGEWWQMISEFTGGDMSLLPNLIEFGQNTASWDNEAWQNRWSQAQEFLEGAMAAWFGDMGINPFASLDDKISAADDNKNDAVSGSQS